MQRAEATGHVHEQNEMLTTAPTVGVSGCTEAQFASISHVTGAAEATVTDICGSVNVSEVGESAAGESAAGECNKKRVESLSNALDVLFVLRPLRPPPISAYQVKIEPPKNYHTT